MIQYALTSSILEGQKLNVNAGKRFERQWAASAANIPNTKVFRIPDKIFIAGNAVRSTESEADFFWFGEGLSFARIVECKAHQGKSIPFSALREHQRASLLEYSRFMESVVAVNLYDSENLRKSNRCWHVPIGVWVEYEGGLGRKSLPLQVLEDDDRIQEFPRIAGSMWDLGASAPKAVAKQPYIEDGVQLSFC